MAFGTEQGAGNRPLRGEAGSFHGIARGFGPDVKDWGDRGQGPRRSPGRHGGNVHLRSRSGYIGSLIPHREGTRRPGQALVKGPDRRAGDAGGCQQVDVDPADSLPVQLPALEKSEHFIVPGKGRLRQRGEEGEDLPPVPQVPAGEFPQDEPVAQNPFFAEQGAESVVPAPEVVHPDGGVNQDQAARTDRLRGGRRRFFSVPPRSARRRAPSRAMSAASPIRTKAVFSVTPVSRAASSINFASMFSVVLICINMYLQCIRVKGKIVPQTIRCRRNPAR